MNRYFSKFLMVALLYVVGAFGLSFVAATPAHADESIQIDSAEWLNATTIRFHYSNNTYAPGPITLDDVEADGSYHSGAKDYPTSETSGYVDFTAGNNDDLYYGADPGYTRYFALQNGAGFASRSNIIRLAAYVVPPHNAPVSTISYSSQPDGQGEYPNPVGVTMSATADTGYQVAQIWTSIDGGDPAAYTAPFQIFGTGSHTINYWSVDNSGIEETHHSTTITLQRKGINIDSAEWVNATTIRFHYSQNTYAPGPMTLTFVEPSGVYHAGARDYATSQTSGYVDFHALNNDDLYFNADPGYTRYYALVGGNFADRSNIIRLPQYAGQIIDTPPTISPLSGGTINEGSTYSEVGSFTDSDSTSWTATIDYGDGSGSQSLSVSGQNFTLSHIYKDNGTYPVSVTVTDDGGQSATKTATIIVNNVAPSAGTITVTPAPVTINSSANTNTSFTDAGVLDTHTATWNWGDGTQTTGSVTESNGSGTVTGSHTYTALGSYTTTVTVVDNAGASSVSQSVIAVIPTGGLAGGNISHTTYNGADLSGQNIAKGNLSVGTFTNDNFTNAVLSQINGSNSTFTNDNFTGANLNKASFSNSNLTGSNFTNATLTQANLSNANLTNVNFTGANIQGANLSGTTKSGVIWSNTICPNGTNSNNDGNTCIGQGGGL